MKKAMIPGSFDPVTRGHMSIVRTAAEIFDEVYVVILANAEKVDGMFTREERMELLCAAVDEMKLEGITNVHAETFDGLTTDAALNFGCGVLVKSARNSVDFEYEASLAQITREFEPSLKTLIIPALPEDAHISSTYIRERIKYGRLDGNDFAPGTVELIRRMRG